MDFYGKNKEVCLGRANTVLEQKRDKEVSENVDFYGCESWSRPSPGGFMTASYPRSCCFKSCEESSKKAFFVLFCFLHLSNHKCL